MTPSKIAKRVVADRVNWILRMLEGIESLPLDDFESFIIDKRNVWAAESCLRRALEALMDLGRHILAKGFGEGTSEYRQIGSGLETRGVLSAPQAELFRRLAGYRNRMVHFYQEISDEELYSICSSQIGDIKNVTNAIVEWIRKHPNIVDEAL